MDNLKVESLEETRAFYKVELKNELTPKEKEGYLKALEIIEKLIKKKRGSGSTIEVVITINIKVFCKVCNWTGQAIVDRERGYTLKDYKCPVCGHSLKERKGFCSPDSEYAVLKK